MATDKYEYTIGYDLDLDVWNWCDATHIESHGYDWRSNLTNEDDIKFFDLIAKMPEDEATKYLYKELPTRNLKKKEFYNNQQTKIVEEFDKKFIKACVALEDITNKKLFYKKYQVKLTTFPKGPYNFEEGYFGYYYENPNSLAKTFMHEVLHFQFIAYWRNNPNSPVSKLAQQHFILLNESLTVVLDESLRDIIGTPDEGYILHRELREDLSKHWLKYYDFESLVLFGVECILANKD